MLTLHTPTTHPLQGTYARRPAHNDRPRWSHTDADASVQWDGVRARWAVCDADGPVWVHPERTTLPQATGWVAARDATAVATGVEVAIVDAVAEATPAPPTEHVGGGYGCCAGRCGGWWL